MKKTSSDASVAAADIWRLGEYLRAKTHDCVRLARRCPDRKTAHELEAMSVEFLNRAARIQQLVTIAPTEFKNIER